MPSAQEFNTIDVLRLEVEDDPAGLVNLVQNPDGDLGGWGWISPVANTYLRGVTPGVLRYVTFQTTVNGQASWFYTEPLAVTAGQYVAARWDLAGSYKVKVSLEWLDAAGALLSSSTPSGYLDGGGINAPTAYSYAATVAPASTAYVRLRFDVYQNTSGGTPIVGGRTYVRRVTVAKAATAGELTGLDYIEPTPYLNILGPTHDLKITRNELGVGLLTALVLDATLDPAVAGLLRPGRRCRVPALAPDVADEWTPLFQGKLRNCTVTYDLTRTDDKRARITLTAVDNVATAASVPREEGVGTIDELPYVLEGVGIPWNVNGSGDQVASASVVANNPNASALDQVAVARDSVHGYAWADRFGVLQAWDAAEIPATVAATLDETAYSALPVDFDTDRCINIVSVKYLRINLATGETVEVPFGPYVDQNSVDQWGPHTAEFTVQGIGEANVPAFAATVLAANATPALRVNSATLPIRTEADIAKALIDLYDLVTVQNAAAAIDLDQRVTGIEHTITPEKWLTELKFAADGGVALPTSTPSPTPAAAEDQWTGLPFETGYTSFTGANFVCEFLKDASGVVHIHGLVKPTAGSFAAAQVKVATLPDGYRPSKTEMTQTATANPATGVTARLFVDPTGEVYVQPSAATAYVALSASWYAG